MDELIRLNVPVPPNIAATFGYYGNARFVAFSWEPVGDQMEYDDGLRHGTVHSHSFLIYLEHPKVKTYVASYNLGSSDYEAEWWLILDQTEQQIYLVRQYVAVAFLKQQHLFPEDEALFKEIDERFMQGLERGDFDDRLRELQNEMIFPATAEREVDAKPLHKAIVDQQQAIAHMIAFLDQHV